MILFRKNFDFLILALVIAGFILVAAQGLGRTPVPEGDEAITLQVPYEMLNRGKIALPMWRYLGGNIENAWHSYTPVYFYLLAGFFRVVGFGLAEGRAFNLLTAVTTLLMIYLIGRRTFDWRVGLIAGLMLVGDITFLERSRLLRNDYAAATFALIAFYLYEIARERRSSAYYLASGFAAGAGVMCHTNIVYMLGAIGLLILLEEGRRSLRSRGFYLFAGGALIVMAYEVIFDIVDYKNYLLQNRQDDVHFRALSPGGIWRNFLEERLRYEKWIEGGLMFPDLPQLTLRIFQLLAVAAIVYLAIVFARQVKRGKLLSEPRVRVFIGTAVVVLFHALIVSHKRVYYIAHIVPWFALCVGIMLRDGIARLQSQTRPRTRFAYNSAIALVSVAFVSVLIYQDARYIARVRDPQLASFDDFSTALKSVIPQGLCPVALKNPPVWLVFPESDRCFASIETRIRDEAFADINGKNYALVTRLNAPPEADYHLLGELRDTPYGNIMVYYTGNEPRYSSVATKRYQFFGDRRGYEAIQPEANQ